jgi:hypothetical protein
MDSKEIQYFERMSKYNPRKIENISDESQRYIDSFVSKIVDAAKEALSENISSKNAKKEISDLMDNIEKLKEGEK